MSSSSSYPPSYNPKSAEQARVAARTPSPTPSEARELQTGAFDWKNLSRWRFWIRREWRWYYVALVVILVVTALITIYHKQIVDWLTPATRWLHDLKLGWLVPIGVLFVISFPPLFGHEIVAILCGLVWGMWIGFAIVAAGTFLGEVGNFYAFRYCCRARGEKLEKNNITYACLAKVVRDGGFKIALVARLSAIPGHFTTAVFSTCGMGIFVFSLAAILSMPKQFITVYLGVLLEQSATGTTDTKSRIITDVVLAITILITFLAMWYIYYMMNKVKPAVIYERRKARQAKLARAASPTSTSSSPASGSADDIPLTATLQPHHSRPPLRSHGSDDVELGEGGWDPALAGAPMQHAGMGREVGLVGGYGYGGGGGYGGSGYGDEYGGGYESTYHDRDHAHQPGGVSMETLGSSSSDTLARVRVSEHEPSRVGAGQGVGTRAAELERDFGHEHEYGQAQLMGSSYRTAWDGLEADDGAFNSRSGSDSNRRLRNPFEGDLR